MSPSVRATPRGRCRAFGTPAAAGAPCRIGQASSAPATGSRCCLASAQAVRVPPAARSGSTLFDERSTR